MPLVVAGIDEAGYGPLLGPLTVGLSVFRVDDWNEGDPAPDLWKRLSGVVCRSATDKKKRIAVDDSKKLKRPNSAGAAGSADAPASGKQAHPLVHLERGVLAFVDAVHEVRPATDAELFAHVGVEVEQHAWYGPGTELPCPVSWRADELSIAANVLRRGLARANVHALELRCQSVGEREFNRCVEQWGTKAAATAAALGQHLRTVWDRWGAEIEPASASGAPGPMGPRVVCDRQGGRTDYRDLLACAVPGAEVVELEQCPERSRYVLTARGPGGGVARAMTVSFQPEAESAHMPVALASMLAKYVRELMMGRFNRYWCGLSAELKPTAGYRGDAQRWLEDAERLGLLTPAHRDAMIRRA